MDLLDGFIDRITRIIGVGHAEDVTRSHDRAAAAGLWLPWACGCHGPSKHASLVDRAVSGHSSTKCHPSRRPSDHRVGPIPRLPRALIRSDESATIANWVRSPNKSTPSHTLGSGNDGG
jgi:hypothetical protein